MFETYLFQRLVHVHSQSVHSEQKVKHFVTMRCAWAIPLFSLAAGSLQEDASSLLQHAHVENSLDSAGCASGKCQPSPNKTTMTTTTTEVPIAKPDVQSPPVLVPALDFSGTIEVPRHVRQTGWMFEMMATIPMAENGITVEMKDVVPALPSMPVLKFPLNHHIIGAEAVRSTLGGRHEYGHLRWTADKMDPTGVMPGCI